MYVDEVHSWGILFWPIQLPSTSYEIVICHVADGQKRKDW
jgi:hypothetical protein